MMARADALAALGAERFDVVVIGGGITGAGVALDAASRGCTVALLEREDFAAGTSSRSSKLVHGGLRYLQRFDLGLVREALLERALMVELAPRLVRPLPFVVPAFGGKHPNRLTGVGLNLYDVMSSDRLRRRPDRRSRDRSGARANGWSPDRHRTISGEEAVDLLPALAARRPTSAYLFYDCQTDDARLVLSVLAAAERLGAVCANRCEVTGLVEDGGRAAGVRARDRAGGGELEVRAAHVVNATGVWADRIGAEEPHRDEEIPHIRPSRGTHVVLFGEDLDLRAGAIVPAGGGRTIFTLPWLGRTLVGTTDRDYRGPLDRVPPDPADIDYLLEACNRFFGTALEPRHLRGAFAGVRPLISARESRKSVDISRRAELYETASGLVTITGGKLTTWRRMAKLAVDRIVERRGVEAPCRTDEIPIAPETEAAALPAVAGVGPESRDHLAARYGDAAREVLALAERDPALARPIVSGLPDVLAEARFAAAREQAGSVADVLLRRTRLGLLDAPALCAPGAEGPRAVARAIGAQLGWDEARVEREAAAWLELAEAEGLAMREGAPGPPVGGHTADRGAARAVDARAVAS